ncbi:hypothetical protein LAZ67_18000926 [Cordylochernes scorpioides]|uniref:RNA-directed DNA polymerase n=1 Tax=Cordylochernes scorpioides TaxID=51811 RepID=A0ABY6LJ14_9ARAC|nr:hypothetical protein LAZ67_18000926 [Cordylochernes scorpioides]
MSKLRPYLYERDFKIVTYHHALCLLKNSKDPTGRLARWALKIQEYDFDIIHISGKKHLDADGISRGPLPETDWDEDFERLFLNKITDEEDKFIESVEKNLIGSSRSIAQNFKEEVGFLFKKNPNPEGRAWLLLVPEKKKRDIMKEYHNHMSNGHLGVARTMYRKKSKYFWPSMLKDVSKFSRAANRRSGHHRGVSTKHQLTVNAPGLSSHYLDPETMALVEPDLREVNCGITTAQLLDLPIIGGCRFLRPPDLLAPARWSGARVRDLIEEGHLTARPTRSALGAFCRRLTSENAVGFGAESAPSSSSLAAAVVLRGTATPFLNGLTTRSARRALDRPRLATTPISRFTSRWSPTIGLPPSRIDWASLRRGAYSGHEADAVLKLALHALPHPAHPASVGPSCPACGSIDRSLGHRYWCCRSIRPLIREAFNIIGRPPDLQAWIFGGSGLEDDALSILASAKLRIYRYFVQVGLGEAVEDPLIAWSRTLQRRGFLPSSPIIIL